jgi:threonine dehydratase
MSVPAPGGGPRERDAAGTGQGVEPADDHDRPGSAAGHREGRSTTWAGVSASTRAILAAMPDVAAHLVPLSDIEVARERLTGRVHRTPLMTSATAAAWVTAATGVRLAGDRLYLKPEQLQKTGSFKPRGMINRIETLPTEARQRGVITLSAGNAGQAYAWAGRTSGVAVTVAMPAAAVRSKVEACLGYGARVVLHGDHVGETLAELERIRDAEGLTFVHPFDDPAVIAGNGSIGLELLEDLPDIDVVVVGVGGGGLISGVAGALKQRRPTIRVVGVEPEGSNALSLAMERNEIVPIRPQSVADGLGAPFAGAWTLAMARAYVDEIVLLDDPTILAGMRFAVERLKQVLEPAGAAALAAMLAGRVRVRAGERVAVVLSGGNVEVGRLGELLAAASSLPGARA